MLSSARDNDDDLDGYNDQAFEANRLSDDDQDMQGAASDEDVDADDMDDHVDEDYKKNAALDRYESDGIDDREQRMIDHEARRQAEIEIDRQRHRVSGLHQRRPDAFMSQDENSADDTRHGTFGGNMRPRYDDNGSQDAENDF